MSTKARKWAWEQGDSLSIRLVLLALAWHSNSDGVSWVKHETLAKMTGLSVKTVRRRLYELEDAGLILVLPRKRDNGTQTSNEYRLNMSKKSGELRLSSTHIEFQFEADQMSDGVLEHGVRAGGQSDRPVVTGDRGPPSTVTNHETSFEDSIPLKAPLPDVNGTRSMEDDLREFISVYPTPVLNFSKVEAEWVSMTADERVSALSGAKRYAAFAAANPQRHVQGALRWLTKKGWYGIRQEPSAATKAAVVFTGGTVFVLEGSPAWTAWVAYRKKLGSTSIPTVNKPEGSGWYFPTEWPPSGRGVLLDSQQ